jgi:hypothetical protein
MKSFILDGVQSCLTCQQAKPERVKYPGLLAPLHVPHNAWDVVSMDFLSGLPKSGRFDCILVVIDKFSKYGHFVPLSHPFSASKIAEVFVDNVYKLHSLPQATISDRDPIFISQFWKQLAKLASTDLQMSYAYQPETDGQTERANQQIECYLRCFISAHPRQ